mgnify:CR=1 FL=1
MMKNEIFTFYQIQWMFYDIFEIKLFKTVIGMSNSLNEISYFMSSNEMLYYNHYNWNNHFHLWNQ